MKTKEELIKERDELQRQIDNFVELKVGKWYKYPQHENWMLYIKELEDGIPIHSCGISKVHEWMYNWSTNNRNSLIGLVECDSKEIEVALIKEAKKRGFKNGVFFIDADSGIHRTLSHDDQFDYDMEDNWLCNGYGDVIFKGGKWSEIVEQKAPEVSGYSMHVDGDTVSFGCKIMNKQVILSMYNSMCKLKVTSFKAFDAEISIEKLKEIVTYLNK